MRYFSLIILAFLVCACGTPRTAADKLFDVAADFYPYNTALGKGRAILFRVELKKENIRSYKIDSFVVHGKQLGFNVKRTETSIQLESEYYQETPEAQYENGKIAKSPEDINDPILVQHDFDPSWIVISGPEGRMRVAIRRWTEKQ